MGELHFLPAQRNNARLAAESTKDIGPMAEHSAKTLPQSSATLVVFDNNGSKTKRYEQLVQLYHADVYRYGYWLCKDPDIAQDLVQETFLRAWKSLDSLLDAGAAKAWLITIVRRENARRLSGVSLIMMTRPSRIVCLIPPRPVPNRTVTMIRCAAIWRH